MGTVVRLTDQQIDHLLNEADLIEGEFKAIYAALEDSHVSKATLLRYRKNHDRFTTAISFLRRQRELGKQES